MMNNLKKLKVLLVSPVPSIDPPGGDVTYTQALLADPPERVEFEPYDEALRRGAIQEHGGRAALKRALETKDGFAREMVLTAGNHLINRLREANVLFREPFRFFSLQTEEYDLIHVHIFSARFENLNCPVVVSNGGELAHLYRHSRGFSDSMIRRRERADRILGTCLGVNVNSEYLPQAARLMTYTHRAERSFAERGVFPSEKIDVIPTFLPSAPPRAPRERPRRVGFIARHFQDKGGPTLLEAWPRVLAAVPEAELLIGGCEPQLSPEEAERLSVIWQPYIPRDELLQQTLPSLDVFAYPTNYDYLPYVLLEVMSRGIPVASSDHEAMPEVMADGAAGLLSPCGNAEALAANLIRLLDPEENRRMGEAARRQFERRFSADVVRPLMRASYDAALAEG